MQASWAPCSQGRPGQEEDWPQEELQGKACWRGLVAHEGKDPSQAPTPHPASLLCRACRSRSASTSMTIICECPPHIQMLLIYMHLDAPNLTQHRLSPRHCNLSERMQGQEVLSWTPAKPTEPCLVRLQKRPMQLFSGHCLLEHWRCFREAAECARWREGAAGVAEGHALPQPRQVEGQQRSHAGERPVCC